MDQWDRIEDVDEAHALLEASDRAAAGKDGFIPTRRRASTVRLVEQGSVWGLRRGGRLVVSVTMDETPTFEPNEFCAELSRVLYMRRLCVAPDAADPMLGLRAVRWVVRRGRAEGYAAVRAEVNPDLVAVCSLLRSVGFDQRGPAGRDGAVAVAQMELIL
jgi:ribosomal protein S18 acetylase RimI-like enzyme